MCQHMYRMGKYKRMYALRERWILSLAQQKYVRRTQDSPLLPSSYIYIHSQHLNISQMAEVFGTIVGTFQLVATLNLLEQLCKDAKVVRQAIEAARSDLTRVSIHLKQLMPHAKHDNDDARLLALTISNCAKRARKVRDLLDTMERCIERAPPIGRLYTALLSIELKQLLNELEIARQEVQGVFATYCYNRRVSVRVRGTLETWRLKLRTRKLMVKEGMSPELHAIDFLSTIA